MEINILHTDTICRGTKYRRTMKNTSQSLHHMYKDNIGYFVNFPFRVKPLIMKYQRKRYFIFFCTKLLNLKIVLRTTLNEFISSFGHIEWTEHCDAH